jgi:hypothetical protein
VSGRAKGNGVEFLNSKIKGTKKVQPFHAFSSTKLMASRSNSTERDQRERDAKKGGLLGTIT